MAANFQVFFNQTRDSLHLHMYGDFDGMSAHELINALTMQSEGSYEVFIDTSDLDTIYPFGLDVFQKQMNSLARRNKGNLIFIGRHRHRFAA